jgi:hypothetical protein
MNRTLTKLAAAGALSLCAAVPALAGSVTQPGETVGLKHKPAGTGLTIPVVAWSTPWTILGARLQFLAAWPAIEVGVQRDPGLGLPGTYLRSAKWPGTSAMDGALATCLEPISTTVARWRGATPRSISGSL